METDGRTVVETDRHDEAIVVAFRNISDAASKVVDPVLILETPCNSNCIVDVSAILTCRAQCGHPGKATIHCNCRLACNTEIFCLFKGTGKKPNLLSTFKNI